jgi:hypothetical protein
MGISQSDVTDIDGHYRASLARNGKVMASATTAGALHPHPNLAGL